MDDPSDAFDATQLVQRVVTDTAAPGCTAAATEDTDSDGYDDTYSAVPPGRRVCFALLPRRNDTVPAQLSPQVYPVRVTFVVDGAEMERETVSFIIPSNP